MASVPPNIVGLDVREYLSKKQIPEDDLSADWAKLDEFYTKKLWHQLTLKLLELVEKRPMQKGENLIELYENFIVTFENKIDPLFLIEIVGHVARRYRDRKKGIAFLEGMEQKVKNNHQAWTLCKVLQGEMYLDFYRDMVNCGRINNEVESTLQDVDGVTPVHTRFYKFSSEYYRIHGPLFRYYKASLRYVGSCKDGTELTGITRMTMAKSIALAGVYSPEIYDLGELAAHPIMQSLKGSKDEWSVDLVRVVAEGDLAGYHKLRNCITPVRYLEKEKELFEKMSLLCLMGMAYSRTPAKRVLTFKEISEKVRVEMDGVEFLVMKAMAKKLIRGFIDEVDKTVTITWVKPRALTLKQIGELAENLDVWCQVVKKAADTIEDKAGDVLTP